MLLSAKSKTSERGGGHGFTVCHSVQSASSVVFRIAGDAVEVN
jgi:hypothetical protein